MDPNNWTDEHLEELRERLRDEARDDPPPRSWAEQAADEAGIPAYGPL